MKKQGCEVEGIDINYMIRTKATDQPSIIISSTPQLIREEDGHVAQDEAKTEERSCSGVRHVLKNVNCIAKPREILAIVGPSGAGKSSLLKILAGKASSQSGCILVNQEPVDKAQFKKNSGYVTQKDTLFPLLTVEETIMFSAKLRLCLPQEQLCSRVKSLILELGVSHIARTRIGDDRVRGISDGERRRVSIGVEIIHDPKVLILDEPTSGLDSTSALQIIDMLKLMAESRGQTIILSIHQPEYRIVKLFNTILLLSNGIVLHHGTMDLLGVNLRLVGLELPLHVSVVEFAIDSIETIQQQQKCQQFMLVFEKSKKGGKWLETRKYIKP
ncbi:unnamed protein product [Sphenostylis stenocarpa]|uniref:ABC transporter domain-containing protein n=1 Tax=Sphenostylis stenocarpa TaxID=92480 RepID=A0AA86TE47_9FABA|nr:unnamed protein product [Sphenostylis stenocarpa]